MPNLIHISEEPDISVFEPRPSKSTDDDVVWAIAKPMLPNYLLPRECPRVTYYASEQTSDEDRRIFLRGAKRVIAVEHAWYTRIVECTLYLYHLPPETFRLHDANAGYYVSPQKVIPSGIEVMPDLLAALFSHEIELRFLPTLWPLSDAVAASTLGFSIIRMRNAQPRLQH